MLRVCRKEIRKNTALVISNFQGLTFQFSNYNTVTDNQLLECNKEFHQLLNKKGLYLEIECNLKIVNYLDITLDLNTGTYKPFCKPNDETLYIHSKSSHPANILKQLTISIETR